jgi:RND superfamily putative drug exporter
VYADIQRAVDHDYTVVFPVAAAVILVMLALMLRSLVAPWYLMASVALGTDYDILMTARLREEARAGRPPREAAALALRHAGPTVGAAGLILAGTFASLTLAGNSVLSQLGFAVSAGIALAAFVMATFFTPSLTALLGRAARWPGHGDRE